MSQQCKQTRISKYLMQNDLDEAKSYFLQHSLCNLGSSCETRRTAKISCTKRLLKQTCCILSQNQICYSGTVLVTDDEYWDRFVQDSMTEIYWRLISNLESMNGNPILLKISILWLAKFHPTSFQFTKILENILNYLPLLFSSCPSSWKRINVTSNFPLCSILNFPVWFLFTFIFLSQSRLKKWVNVEIITRKRNWKSKSSAMGVKKKMV